MLPGLCCVLAGCVGGVFSAGSAAVRPVAVVTVLRNQTAVLSCPDARTDVTWSRYRNSQHVTLVTVKNGHETSTDRRFGSRADGSLVLANAAESDEGMFFCNGKQTYLSVSADPSVAVPTLQPDGAATPPTSGVSLNADQSGAEPGRQASAAGKAAGGVAAGATLLVLVAVTLRFWSKKKAERKPGMNNSVMEAIYQEIDSVQPGKDPDDPGPQHRTVSAAPAPSSSAPTQGYMQRSESRSGEECVYSLLQTSDPTGGAGQ